MSYTQRGDWDVVIDGVSYTPHARFEVELSSDGPLIYPLYPSGHRVQEVTNRCECCDRGDWREVVFASWADAIEAGWLTSVGGS